MLSPADFIAQFEKAGLHDLPGISAIVALEITYILEHEVSWAVPPEDFNDLMKESPAGCVVGPKLTARFRKWLARKACAQHVVLRDTLLGFSDISEDLPSHFWEVLDVNPPKLVIDL
jgi:hypothetical protein